MSTAEELRLIAAENMPRPTPRGMYQPLLDAADRIEELERECAMVAQSYQDLLGGALWIIEDLEAGREVERTMIRNAMARIEVLEKALREIANPIYGVDPWARKIACEALEGAS